MRTQSIIKRSGGTLADRFEHQVRLCDDTLAVLDGARNVGYAELNRAADALASRLLATGLTSGAVVAIMLPRGVELVVAAVGVAKAGMVQFFVDPEYPDERVARLHRAAGASAVVTTPGHARNLPGIVLELSYDPSASGATSGQTPHRAASESDLELILPTSGSTGTPRLVALERAALSGVLDHQQPDIAPSDRVLLAASVGFDASAFELWATLTAGATLVVVAPGELAPAALLALIERHRVTGMLLTAALFQLFSEGDVGRARSLRWVLVGGEEPSARHMHAFAAALPGCRLYNCYGPTEATVFATWFQVKATDGRRERVPIGWAAHGKCAYLLNDQLQPCAAGEVGELYLGGSGLARGYHAMPGLTASRFVPDPFGEPGSRMYRTGDLARRLQDGALEFVSRADDQVKIRGYRVELGEVEAALRAHPSLAQVAVVGVVRPDGQRVLCAYVVPVDVHAVSGTSVRHWLADRLPAHCVPARVVLVDKLPLTSNGKVDRAALPAAWGPRPLAEPAVPARNELEQRLASAWADLLGVATVGVKDNFFELGGDSLTGMALLATISKAFQANLSVIDLVDNQTIAELAPVVDRALADADDAVEVGGRDGN